MVHGFANHIQWPAVKAACDLLHRAGHQAYLAGGCVRDLLMGRSPHDFDLATDATPEQVVALFPNALTVGREFGVTIVPYDGFQLEIATFREDGDYKDGRRPEAVVFSSAQEDAKRRDFTVNALFLDPISNQVIDYVGGQADLTAKIIKAVGNPEQRFTEDKLRLLRAVRFGAQLRFVIEAPTWRAIQRLAPTISVVSRERVRDELFKLFAAPARLDGLHLLQDSHLLDVLFSRLAGHLEAASDGYAKLWWLLFEAAGEWELSQTSTEEPETGGAAESASKIEKSAVWMSLFFWPLAHEKLDLLRGAGSRPKAESARLERELRASPLKELKLDGRMIDAITWSWRVLPVLLRPHSAARAERLQILMSPWFPTAELISRVTRTALARLIDLIEDERATIAEIIDPRNENQWRVDQQFLTQQGGQIGERLAPWLTGEDLKAAGISPGAEMGVILQQAYEKQITGEWPTREDALAWLREKR